MTIVSQAWVAVAILLTFLAGPVSAIGILRLRKRRARADRRTPLNGQLLREPGHTLREQVEEARNDMQWGMFEASAIPLAVVALALGQSYVVSTASLLVAAPLYALIAIGMVVYTIHKMWKCGKRLDRLRAGLDGEVAVGQELNRLMLQGAIVFHDVPGEKFNIDHVVVCKAGVFAIETKGYTKRNGAGGAAEATVEYDGNVLRFPAWSRREPLEQSRRQAAWLSKWLSSAVGGPVRAQPVVALPGWFVKRTGRGDVWVYSGKELAGLPKARGAQGLGEQDMQRVAHQLEQRCRAVMPQMANSDGKI